MNLTQSEELLSEQTQDYLKMLYRQSKITGSVQINFIAAKLGLPSPTAAKTAQFLQQIGMVFYGKYGRIELTEDGKRYAGTLLASERCAQSTRKTFEFDHP